MQQEKFNDMVKTSIDPHWEPVWHAQSFIAQAQVQYKLRANGEWNEERKNEIHVQISHNFGC